jgi:hypothetical protein
MLAIESIAGTGATLACRDSVTPMHVLLVLTTLMAQERPQVVLANSAAEAVFDLGGGSFVSFRLKNQNLNPLRWQGPADQNVVNRPMAHFLCLDRWGAPSEAEIANGMFFHGEAARVAWKAAPDSKTSTSSKMSAFLPMANLEVQREAHLDPRAALLNVRETVSNRNALGKLYNMVQHATIGPPFLDETTLVDSNAGRGFMQSSPLPNPEEPAVQWPNALKDGRSVDLRHLRDDPMPNVVSYVIDSPLGWVTASNAKHGLLIGYLWKTSEYPWFNAWRHVDDKHQPLARGLEFGTTGLHQPFPVLLKKGAIFGRPIFSYLDAKESVTRSWAAFLLQIPNDWKGVSRVSIEGGKVLVVEHGERPRNLEIPSKPAGF